MSRLFKVASASLGSPPTLLFVINIPEFFLSHRLPLAIAARERGFDVHVATGPGDAAEQIVAMGFKHHPLSLSRSGRNPLGEMSCLWGMVKLFRKLQPALVHLVTIKPVLYGGLAARLVGVPAMVAAISGLGTVFVKQAPRKSWLRRGVEWFYRLALGHSNLRVIFQNPDDRAVLIAGGAIQENQTLLIRGSGVALEDYPMREEPQGIPVITFASRLLKDKGVREFVDSARILRQKGIRARFLLAGSPDPGNLSSISDEDIRSWAQDGLIEPLGYRSDIPELFAQSNLIVLPSYREGLPKVLIEAAACGRAVVTTDVPGCRDAIEPGKTGVLVPVQNAQALAQAIEQLVEDPNLRRRMGSAGRTFAEQEFTIGKVIEMHLQVYQELLQSGDCL